MQSQIQKEQKQVNKILKKLNKQMKEDCFAGRFLVVQTGKKCFSEANYSCYCPKLYTYNEAADPCWRYAYYTIRFIDKEEPERNFKAYFSYSKVFGLKYLGNELEGAGKEIHPGYPSNIWMVMNDFIIKSDFWKKWDDPEYKKTHWYSGKQLEDYERFHKNLKKQEQLNNGDTSMVL